jgi:ribosome biogenesis protein YTM1
MWDPRAENGSLVKLKLTSHAGWVSGVKWSPDNAFHLVSTGYDGKTKIWDIRSTAPLYTISDGDVKKFGVAWCGGHVAVAGEDAKLNIFSYESTEISDVVGK